MPLPQWGDIWTPADGLPCPEPPVLPGTTAYAADYAQAQAHVFCQEWLSQGQPAKLSVSPDKHMALIKQGNWIVTKQQYANQSTYEPPEHLRPDDYTGEPEDDLEGGYSLDPNVGQDPNTLPPGLPDKPWDPPPPESGGGAQMADIVVYSTQGDSMNPNFDDLFAPEVRGSWLSELWHGIEDVFKPTDPFGGFQPPENLNDLVDMTNIPCLPGWQRDSRGQCQRVGGQGTGITTGGPALPDFGGNGGKGTDVIKVPPGGLPTTPGVTTPAEWQLYGWDVGLDHNGVATAGPRIQVRAVRDCPPGWVLCTDGYCRQKNKLGGAKREYPKPPDPILSAQDQKTLRKIESIRKKVKRAASSAGFSCRNR